MGFASQPSQVAEQQPHKAPQTLLRQAEPPPAAAAAASLTKDQRRAPSPPAAVPEPKKRLAARLFQDTQTEYVRIETASKRPSKDLLTERQKEVAALHRQGTLSLLLHILSGISAQQNLRIAAQNSSLTNGHKTRKCR